MAGASNRAWSRVARRSGIALGLVTCMSALSTQGAHALSLPPAAQQFTMSSLTVTPGSQVGLHWGSEPSVTYLLASGGSTALPGFASGALTWPGGSGASWESTWHWWATASNSVLVSIPRTAANGTIYKLQLDTCDSTVSTCSHQPGGSSSSEVTLIVTTAWRIRSYVQDFRRVETVPELTGGVPLDVAFAS